MTSAERELLIEVADALATLCAANAHILVNGGQLQQMGQRLTYLTRRIVAANDPSRDDLEGMP